MRKLCGEGKYALGALTAFAIWLYIVLPAAYSQTAQNSEVTEFWPAIFGYRLKVTDTLLALFTLCLFVATLYLWRATKQLVVGAERTAERQLRAYVYVRKTDFKAADDGTLKISYCIENFGHTPAHNVRLISIAKVVDWKDGRASEIPTPDNVQTVGSMAPNGDFFEFDERLEGKATVAELKAGTKAIFLTGNIIYETVFGSHRCITNFRFYIGGDQGCDGEEMYAASQGNDAT